MVRLVRAAVAVALVVGAVFTAAPAHAYPGCYWAYQGCYLVPGWYDGYYWGGGPWYGWNGYGPNPPFVGCPVPYVDGRCGG